MNVENVVGNCPVDQTLELLVCVWANANSEVREAFVDAYADELRELLPPSPQGDL